MNAKNLTTLDHEKFLEEAALLAIFTTDDSDQGNKEFSKEDPRKGSQYVTKLIGMVLAKDNIGIYVATELCQGGDLKQALMHNDNEGLV